MPVHGRDRSLPKSNFRFSSDAPWQYGKCFKGDGVRTCLILTSLGTGSRQRLWQSYVNVYRSIPLLVYIISDQSSQKKSRGIYISDRIDSNRDTKYATWGQKKLCAKGSTITRSGDCYCLSSRSFPLFLNFISSERHGSHTCPYFLSSRVSSSRCSF